MAITRKTLDHPVLMLMIFILLGIMGVFTIGNIAVSLFPDIEIPYVMVMTTYRNANPESVERSVTQTLESALVSVSGLKEISSTSSESSSVVSLQFEYGTNLDLAVNDVRDKLERAKQALPDGADTPSIMIMDASATAIMRIAIRGNRNTDDLRELADGTVTDILEQADGVAEASVMGGRDKIVRVDVSENRLAAYNLTISAISSALAGQNLELSGGKITEGSINYSVRTTGEFASIDEIRNSVITTVNGQAVRLSDLATVQLTSDDVNSMVYINGEPGVYVSVTKQSGANSVTVADNVYAKIEQLRRTLPGDITLEVIQDDTTVIRDTIKTLVESLVQGLLLAVIILFVFLQNFKSTFIIAISIPISLLITIMCMSFAGITFNMITLTGLILGLGMIVDASVVMIENIYVYRSRGAKPKISAILGSSEMLMSVVSGNITTICVFVPFLLYMSKLGMMGQIFRELVFTIVIALLSSLFVAIFLVPVMAGKFLPLSNRKEKPVRNPLLKGLYAFFQKIIDVITHGYRFMLRAALSHRAATIIVSLSMLAVSLILIPTLRISMMGDDVAEDSVTINISLPIGTALEETENVVLGFNDIVLREVQGYKTITVSVGGGRSSSTYTGSIQIMLPAASEQIDTSQDIQRKLRPYFSDFPQARFGFSAGIMGQMTASNVVVEIRSDDLDSALSLADNVRDVMDSLDDLGEGSIDTTRGLPQVEIVIDRERAAAFGVSVASIASEINYAMNGVTSTRYRENGKEYNVKIWYRPEDREKMSDLSQIYVASRNGLMSVENLARIERGLSPVSIRRTNQTRIVTVRASIISGVNANIVQERLQEAISNSVIIPDNATISYTGSWNDVSEQVSFYSKIALLAVILVFGVMAGTYESFKAPFINLMTIPFLVVGVVFIFKFTGQSLSMVASMGVIMLIGIVVNNGIILVDYISLLVERGYKMKDACLEAGVSRLRPVLMTTLTTILGMLPMCFQSEGSAAMVKPIGVAIVGGLTTSTFVTLFFVPVIYSLIMSEKKHSVVELPEYLSEMIERQKNKPATANGDVQISIVANQSVEDDIIELLEQVIPSIKYTVIPLVTGKGKNSYKLGNPTWPEQNFMLVSYMSESSVPLMQAAVEHLKKKFPNEGIKIFVTIRKVKVAMSSPQIAPHHSAMDGRR